MRLLRKSLSAAVAFGLVTSAQAKLTNEKITLNPNMVLKYNNLSTSVDTIGELFTEGVLYGRLRTNVFYWDWRHQEDNKAMGIGGSLVYKTASLNGFSATVAGYTTQNPGWYREDIADAGSVKAGKDTFSRHRLSTSGDYGMNVLGQAYLQYNKSKTSIKAGRFMYESVFTKSNDTKMIPNTFDGVSIRSKEFDKTLISFGYLAKQKLRDHTTSHDVIAYDGWVQNDDSAVNKNLTVARVGDNNKLIVTSVTNKSVKNLKTNLSYLYLPDIVSNLTLEAHYGIKISKEWKVVPGFRYMRQYDILDADYNVACLKGDGNAHVGYTDPTSLDSDLLALRVDFKHGAFLGRVGYSKIADKADIIAPWRGFPTGGFSRAMAQYNWYANTKTYMLRADYDFGKAGLIPGFSIMARYAIQDFDDNKDDTQADSDILHIDMRKNIGENLEAKVRLGFVEGDGSILKSDGSYKAGGSYNEYRFELNYFF